MGKREKERELLEQQHAQQIEARERELAQLRQENQRLKQDLGRLSQRVAMLEKQEASVLDAIVRARETAAETVGAAQKQAQEIYSSAVEVTTNARDISANARSIITQAEEQAQSIMAGAHAESTRVVAKANERAAFMQTEARRMCEEYQSLVDNVRERMHSLLRSSIENIRDFAAKLTVLYAEDMPTDLEPLLTDSVRDIELHLKQIGAPPRDPNAPAIGYTDAQELVKALQRLQGRLPVEAPADEGGLLDEPEERVWTVDEVMQKNAAEKLPEFERLVDTAPRVTVPPPMPPMPQEKARAPHLPPESQYAPQFTKPMPQFSAPSQYGPTMSPIPPDALDVETDESLGTEAPPERPEDGISGYRPSELSKDTDVSAVESFDGLNLRNSAHHSKIDRTGAAMDEYVKSDPLKSASREGAFEGLMFMGQQRDMAPEPKESPFDGLNLRQGGHSNLTADPQGGRDAGVEAGILPPPHLRRTKEREHLPDDFVVR